MFDTMTLTKVVGSFCGALLVFLMGSWAAESIYHTAVEEAEGEQAQAYTIDTGVEEAAEEGEPAVDFEVLLASADVTAGERVFSKCRSCHQLEEGANATGPYLYGVVGRPVDAAEGYNYSGALEEVADVWSPDHLNGFLENPRGYAPGTTMSFNGLPSAEDRANIIAYLDTTDG